jgi:hypothetical protein
MFVRPGLVWIRRAAAVVAVVAAIDGLVVMLLTFAPGALPTAGFLTIVLMPAFVAMFFPFGVTVLETATGPRSAGRRLRSGSIPLRGRRRTIASALGVFYGLIWLSMFVAGGPSGQTYQSDGRYYLSNHGALTEVSREVWAKQDALDARLFAGAVLVFAGTAALYLTQPIEDETVEQPGNRRLVPPPVGRPSVWRRLQGYEDIDVFGRGPVDAALARLRGIVPARAAPRRPGAFDVLADWDERRSRVSQAFPLRLEGDLTATGPESFRFTAVLGPAPTGASRLLPRVLGGLVPVAIGVYLGVRWLAVPGAEGLVAFAALWVLIGLIGAFNAARTPRRFARRARRRIVDGLAPESSMGPYGVPTAPPPPSPPPLPPW